MGVVINAVGEGARTGIGRFGAGVCDDARLSLSVGVDAGKGGRREASEMAE